MCPSCGHAVEPQQKFCSECGLDLRSAAPCDQRTPKTYTPDHLAERILEDRHALIGERKQVTVMFADIVDSTEAIQGADPEDAARFLNSALQGMMTQIHRYEGTVNELRGDGLMALFGAPIAHEDHAVRAARAALAVPDGVRRATAGRAQARVGLHSGEVLVRGVGNDLSIEYQALGPTVHLAARMESLAEPNTAYITKTTRDLIQGRVESQHVGAMKVKGVAEPLDVYELSDVMSTTAWEARATRGLTLFTGRSEEMAKLERAVDLTNASRGSVVNISGGAGVGKSRLVHELVENIDESEVTLLRSDASPYESKTAYHPIKQLLKDWLPAPEDGEGRQAALEVALGEISPDMVSLAPVFSSLLELDQLESWEELPAPRRQRATRDAITTALSGLAKQKPVVLIVEDLHWVDSETEGVLEEIVELANSERIAVILTFRPEFTAPWDSGDHITEVALQPLSDVAAMSFFECLLGEDESLDDVKALMASHAEGVPLYMEELVRSLADEGTLEGDPGNYRAARRPDDINIPDTIHSVIAARIDRLPEGDKRVLEVAAVVGDTVPLSLASHLLHRTEDVTLDVLNRLVEREFLAGPPTPHAPEFRFAHALIRDVAYNSLPLTERRAMHAEMVTVIEQQPGPLPIERLSYHAMSGEMWGQAVTYTLEAADRSISKSAFREASSFLRDATKALTHLPSSTEVVDLAIDTRMRLRVAETGAQGGLKRLVSDLDEAAELAEAHGDLGRRAHVAIHAGYTANMLGDANQADHHAETALTTAQQIPDEYVTLESQLLLAQSHLYSGRFATVPKILDPHMEYLTTEFRHERMDQTMIRSVVATSHYAVATAALGLESEAIRWVDTAEQISLEADRPFDLMYSYFARSKCLNFLRSAEAVAAHETSERIADENGIWFMKTFARPWLGHALLRQGKVEEARDLLRSTQAAARRVELPFTDAEARAFAAIAARMTGEDPSPDAEFALEFGQAHGNPILVLLSLIALERTSEAIKVARDNGLEVWATELEENSWLAVI